MMLSRKRGLTMIEVMVSMGILGILVVAITSATLILKGATVESGISVDMESTARRILTELRRDLRSSGVDSNGTAHFRIIDSATATDVTATGAPGDTIIFRKRHGPDDTVIPSATGWSEEITYRRVPDPKPYKGIKAPVPPRFRLEQVHGTLVIPKARDISSLTFTRIPGDGTILVHLELTRNNPHWNGTDPPPAITRVYEDQIQMLNKAP